MVSFPHLHRQRHRALPWLSEPCRSIAVKNPKVLPARFSTFILTPTVIDFTKSR